MFTLAAAATLSLLPAITTADAAGARRAQQSDSELIALFEQVTEQRSTETKMTTEVVSVGTVYARCPDLSLVTGPMYDSDANKDGFINQEEYVEFTDAISGGLLAENGWDGGFNDMPLTLQETYLVLSCLCELYSGQPWGGVGCCKTNDVTGSSDGTGIRTDGTEPGTTTDADQLQYLTYVCGTMSESLENVGGTIMAPPSSTPIPDPTQQPVMPVRDLHYIWFILSSIHRILSFCSRSFSLHTDSNYCRTHSRTDTRNNDAKSLQEGKTKLPNLFLFLITPAILC